MKWIKVVSFGAFFVLMIIFGINIFYSTMFPINYEKEVAVASEKFNIEKATIFSIINIESHFKPQAISKKGAVGLMQILPGTAKEFANKLGLENFDLKNPKDNIMIGTAYFAFLKKKFNDETLALCAYNAGPANVNFWLGKEEYSADGLTLSEIPFKETKNYIKKFEQNYKFYSKKFGGDNRS